MFIVADPDFQLQFSGTALVQKNAFQTCRASLSLSWKLMMKRQGSGGCKACSGRPLWFPMTSALLDKVVYVVPR